METKCAEEVPTLMQAFERLTQKCSELKDVAQLTERLNRKLNRTDGRPESIEASLVQKEPSTEKNIVELFNSIADKMDVQIHVIGNNTELSMRMID